ncbi:MAG: Bax inhibitor-1 family protein [Bacilli bacterium]|jgi:FtsH-binding integral membrane protein
MLHHIDTTKPERPEQLQRSRTSLLAGAFGWLFIGLLIAMALAVGIALIINAQVANAVDDAAIELLLERYLVALAICGLVQFIMIFVVQFRILRRGAEGSNLLIPYVLYTANTGVLLSFLVLITEIEVLVMALGLTVVIFGLMALYARFTKQNLIGVGLVATFLIIGALILGLFNWLLQSDIIGWIVTFAFFGAVMLITMYDIWQLQRISETGANSRNLALFFALHLFIDFVYILVRVIYFLNIARSRR